MENVDPTIVGITLAVGGIIGFAVSKAFGGSDKSKSKQQPQQEFVSANVAGTSKKQKKKNKEAPKPAMSKSAEIAAKLAAAKKAKEEAEALLASKRKENELHQAQLKEAREAELSKAKDESETSKKKKTKKKKNTDSAETNTPKEPAAEPVVVHNPPPVHVEEQDDDDSWEVVSKKKKQKPVSGDIPADPNATTSTTIDVGDCGPVVVGPGGSSINAIQEKSGAKINLSKGSSVCTIEGTYQQVEDAKALIFDIVGNQGKEIIDTGAMRVLVFGKGGATIRKIQQDSGARLDMEKDSSIVTISGDLESVRNAKSMIENILKSSNVSMIQLDDKEVASVIGKGGENIKRLTSETGAAIDIKPDNTCSISGTPDQVLKARQLVRLYIEHRGPPPEATETLTIPIDQGRLLIGKKGVTINNLQGRTRTRITVEHTMAMSTVVVAGSKADVSNCVQEIYKMIEENSYKEVVQLPTSNLVKVILGVKGETINRIRDDSNARLEIADDSSSVTIIGTKAQVGKAVSMVNAKIAEELGPPPVKSGQKQHAIELGDATGKIIGTAGSNIARLEKEYGVTVVIKHGTTCYVTGPPSSADKAKKDIDDVLTKHAELMEKAKKQEEALAQVAMNQKSTALNDSGVYSGWDVPMETGSWDAPAGDDVSWNAPPNASGW